MFGPLKRLWNLFFGWLGLGVKSLEEKRPEIAYENAINAMITKYAALKSAAAGLINHRTKIEARVASATTGLSDISYLIDQAVNSDNDDVALVLLGQQEDLEKSLAEAQSDLLQATKDAENAKSSLVSLKSEIDKLRNEKDRVIAQIQDASARKAIQEQLDGLSLDDDIKALENVRESAERLRAEVQIGDELTEDSIENKLRAIRRKSSQSSARSKLDKLKAQRSETTSESLEEKSL